MSTDHTTRKAGAPSRQPAAGTILGGRFEVVRERDGGLLLGRDTATLGSVVITTAETALVSTEAEVLIARHVAELKGPGRPVHAGREGEWFVLVAPLVRGVPLAERLARGGLDLGAMLQVASDLLATLTDAHHRGLLHLAISPATVMVNPDGRVRSATLTGFGSAVLHDCLAAGLSPVDVRYAAPERAGVLDRPVDHRTDLYSLGLVLHECLTGHPAYAAGSDGELLRRRLTDPPPPLRGRFPEIPPEVEAELLRLLAADPAGRPDSAAEVARALAAVAGPPRRPAGPGAARPRPAATAPASRLIGREPELARLVGHLRAAAGGRGSAALLEGPAGAGKTRLLDDLSRQAEAAGAIVLRGAAPEYPPTPAGALDGLVDGLLDLAGRDPACLARLRGAAGQGRAELCTLLPRLRPLLGGDAAAGRPADPVRWSGAPALARLLAAAGSPASPALIVLDDSQWADASVLELIAAWGSAPTAAAPRHAVLLAAYRAADLDAEHPLRRIAALGRVVLGPLDEPAAAELARAIGPPSDGAAARFIALAGGGNPGRAELAAAYLRDGRPTPGEAITPGDLAAGRVDLLPGDVRRVLGAGALVGRSFSLDTVAAMLGRGDVLVDLAGTDAERRLLVSRSPDDPRRLVFRDDRLRAALLTAMTPGERQRLHARASDVLPDAGDLIYPAAWHAVSSGDAARLVPRALTAARAAVARQAPDVAELYLRAARRHAAELGSQVALEVVEELAGVHLAQGRVDLAEEQLAAAARLTQEPGRRATIRDSLARLAAPASTADDDATERRVRRVRPAGGLLGHARRRLTHGLRDAGPQPSGATFDALPSSPAPRAEPAPVPAGRPAPPPTEAAPPPTEAAPPRAGPPRRLAVAPTGNQAAAPMDERLATLMSGGRGIASAITEEAIFAAVRDFAVPLLRGRRAVIVHLAGPADRAVVSGYSPECDEALARICSVLGVRAASSRQAAAVSADDAGDHGIDAASLVAGGARAAICAPIPSGDAVTACIYVDRMEPAGPFGPEELRFAEFIAEMAGTALENAAGYARVASLSRSLEQRVEERTAQLADANRQLDLSLQRLTEAFERERAAAVELKHQAFHDPLTDLANRTLFIDRVQHALELAGRTGSGLAVMFLDLDDFKTVNDSLGHPAGDELLIAVAGRLGEVLRRADTAARLGGDEFGILLEGSDRDGATRAAERILESLETPFKLAAKEVFVHASIGIALSGGEAISVDSLLRNADVAMYMAKTAGKRGFEVFEQRMHDDIVRRLELKDDLHRGIELQQFAVHYQPIVDVASSRIHGLEALIRWNHPEHGMISPLDFIPLAEETGMIRVLGDWVLRTACEATRGWQAQAGHVGERLTIGVNLSARELHEPGLVDCVAAALQGSGLDPADLILEITESVLMTDTAAAIARLRELKALGVRLAIDDFGTGYSSLSYLKHLPVDIVKIDKEFVDDIAQGPQEAALAGAIVALAETLHLKTVAEGIEKPDQLRALRRLGCDYGQGYLFSRPLPAAAIGELLAGDRRFPVGEPSLRLVGAV